MDAKARRVIIIHNWHSITSGWYSDKMRGREWCEDDYRFISAEDLCKANFHLTLLKAHGGGPSLNFEPSFFKPADTQIFHDHPVLERKKYRLPTINSPSPHWDQILRSAIRIDQTMREKMREKPFLHGPKNPNSRISEEHLFGFARHLYNRRLDVYPYIFCRKNENQVRATRSFLHRWISDARRANLPNNASLLDYFGYLHWSKEENYWGSTIPYSGFWLNQQKPYVLEDPSKEFRLAHAVVTLEIPYVNANQFPTTLTLWEIQAILQFLWNRTNILQFQDDPFQPMLLIAYMGVAHARITQAFFSDTYLNLQCSPLFYFGDENAPVELFASYYLSKPVSPEKVTPFRTNGSGERKIVRWDDRIKDDES